MRGPAAGPPDILQLEVLRAVILGVQGRRGAGLSKQGVVEIPPALALFVHFQALQAGGTAVEIAVIGAIRAAGRNVFPK